VRADDLGELGTSACVLRELITLTNPLSVMIEMLTARKSEYCCASGNGPIIALAL
jgi:hypothetical protein